jgi:quinol monooxygenase YgiN
MLCDVELEDQPMEEPMQTIGIVLNVGLDHVDAFEDGFRTMEAPIWADLHARGVLNAATLTKLDISTRKTDGAAQYLVVAIFASDEGHHEHDTDPRFEAWNKQADAYQVAEPFVFGGDTIVNVGV